MRILLVEDDCDLGAVVVELLVSLGHEVVHASNAPQALRVLDEVAPEAVVIDLRLPVFDGNEIAADIRLLRAPPPRLVAFSSWVDGVDSTLFDAVVMKSTDIAETTRALVGALDPPAVAPFVPPVSSRAESEDTVP